MGKTYLAERVLRIVCGRPRATEVVGDLLEQGGVSQTELWWVVFRMMYAMSWRWLIAIVLAALTSLLAITRYVSASPQFHSEFPEPLWLRWGVGCMLAALCAWTATLLNAFQFGIRDRLTYVSAGFSGVCVALAFCGWSPHIRPIASLTLLAFTSVCLSLRALRAAFVSLLLTAGAYAAVFVMTESWIRITKDASRMLLVTQFFGYWFLSFLAAAWVLRRMRGMMDRDAARPE